ncbi:protein-methionine-sulfoxide reductase heme-binding subunit MsrQ [Falsiroseomonas ponticola]|uniref:sulfite oxidase heme-binding subunit YedZ n=1 Tax=Falsiroseomonas ponticola TaxID=2786951 RepID=UPI0019330850|nr:ferric reductase-like transmembrane domain-containing protein [Roseomonas ponticola]
MSATTLAPDRPSIPWPWLTRGGRFSWTRMLVLVSAIAPGLVLLWLLGSGQMGAEPWKAAAKESGTWAIRFLLISLAVTPLRHVANWPQALTFRRMLGLVALGYAVLHLLMYAGHMAWDLPEIASEILLRFYLTLGFLVLLGLVVLGVTSTDGWQARLGRRWKALHRAVYALAAAGIFHQFLQAKSRADGAVLMAGVFLFLMAWRALPGRWRASPLALAGLAVLAAAGAAGVEFAWYALSSNLPAARILAANLDPGAGLRPAQLTLVLGLAVAVLPWLARLRWPGRAARAR